MGNFYKLLWTHVEGGSAADGSKYGGVFLRNVSKIFQDRNFNVQHEWNDIVLKISQYTKNEAYHIELFNNTQLSPIESTLETLIRFEKNEKSTSCSRMSALNCEKGNYNIAINDDTKQEHVPELLNLPPNDDINNKLMIKTTAKTDTDTSTTNNSGDHNLLTTSRSRRRWQKKLLLKQLINMKNHHTNE